jgi:hypothetical protein
VKTTRLLIVLALAGALAACSGEETAREPSGQEEAAASTVSAGAEGVETAEPAGEPPVPGETESGEIAELGAEEEGTPSSEEPAVSGRDVPEEGLEGVGAAETPDEGDVEPREAAAGFAERVVSPSGLHVLRAYVCKGIEQNEPTEAGKSFVPEADGILRLCCFSEIGGAGEEATILHVWYWGDREMARVELPVRSFRWRTWSTKKILDEWQGEWRVDITDQQGFVLTSLTFSVE